jgi:predicted RNase H-like HicB family nuclease/lambda repressor-like predicted transcriptional regulator
MPTTLSPQHRFPTRSPRTFPRLKLSPYRIAHKLSMQRPYKIVLYHDGDTCRAAVPELPGCVASGENYLDALICIQRAMSDWIAEASQPGAAAQMSMVPEKMLSTLHRFASKSKRTSRSARRCSPIKKRLIEKFGELSNRELAARIGIVAADSPIMLSSAAAGNGTRKVRCAIAVALDEPPSKLWPERFLELCAADDAVFHSLKGEARRV